MKGTGVLALSCLLLLVLAVPALTASQPDLQIRPPAETAYRGVGIYHDLTAQTATLVVPSAMRASYYYVLRNDGTRNETFLLTGTAGNATWSIRYYSPAKDGKENTSSLTRGLRVTLRPGAVYEGRADVQAVGSVKQGTAFDLLLSAYAVADSSQSDAVRATTINTGLRAVLMTTSPASFSAVGTPVRLTAVTVGTGMQVLYRFEAWHMNWGKLTWEKYILQDYSPRTTCTFTPRASGNYYLVVMAKESISEQPFDTSYTAIYTVR